MPINRVLEAIEEIKNGRMIIMIDDEDRENEGDLVYAASFTTAEKVNFMASKARGLICVAISAEIAKRLELTPMVTNNNSQHETAFTVSVDALNCTTGISAQERNMTIALLADAQSRATDLVRPGHIFPLTAKQGGVLVRVGHTEGTVDLCRLAGLAESGVICEIMKEDGEMARRDDLDIFAKEHNLKTVFISDIVEFRLKKESLIRSIYSEKTCFMGAETIEHRFIDHMSRTHFAFVFKEVSISANVKFHIIKPDIETFSNFERYENMQKSVEFLKQYGGVLIFLDNKEIDQSELKEYGIGAQIISALGIHQIRLLTKNRSLEFSGLSGFGLEITDRIGI